MACKECDYTGIIRGHILLDAEYRPVVKVCPVCNDVDAYNEYIRSTYGSVKQSDDSECKVIQFGKKMKFDK